METASVQKIPKHLAGWNPWIKGSDRSLTVFKGRGDIENQWQMLVLFKMAPAS